MSDSYYLAANASQQLTDDEKRRLIDYLELSLEETRPTGEFLMIEDGELSDSPVSRQDLLEQAGRLMDKACSWDILGDVLFVEDGEWYVAHVETVIGRANPEWLKDRLEELSDEIGSDQPEYRAIMAKLEELKNA